MSADNLPQPPPAGLDERAAEAERSVTTLFAGSLGGLPLTHLARVAHPAPTGSGPAGRFRGPWHYWWQAHYLDAVVDAGLRALRTGDRTAALQHAARADRLLKTIRLRNGARWVNDFYDDMAWLALAAGRLRDLHEQIGRTARTRRLRSAGRHLTAQLRAAETDDLGGGLFWSRDRDFKNTPATGPAALHLARLGEVEEARRLVDWLYARLWSPESGLVQDGIRLTAGTEVLVPDVWSYNQGPVLGALLTLGDPESLGRASALVAAVDAGLTMVVDGTRVLRTHGGGDGGLFTGILVRHLALAAAPGSGLGAEARATARRLVDDTAQALWRGRAGLAVAGRRDPMVFPLAPGEAAPRMPLELSPQLQAWIVLEAAATLA
ncbi:glycoside hydrolase family 76 protein [Terrabacter aerolatus]|uniref:Glycoside hydrolase n=1 Tax=Terrabacter aerolatus TaxID=422442 RepID=A0A512D383_9MICO|nr:glycoside hydrolase family 76 protein [Terrabacter aerolatus]GEO30917.1 glycoside hydrolase [Terrabacter aerolatus]